MLQHLGFAAAGLGLARFGWAEGASGFTDVAAFIESQVKEGVVPGASVAVTVPRKGKTLYEGSFGTYCSHERKDAPLDGTVVHPLYSFSKLVAATVVVMVHQEGLLDFDAPVSKYIPKFTGGGKEKVTLRHLLTHSAGMPNVKLGPVFTEEKWAQAVEAMCAAPVDWEPGSRCEYHGLTGLFMAAHAARVVTGKTWDALCRERLFEPLGTGAMGFEMPDAGTKVALTPQPAAAVLPNLRGNPRAFYELSFLGHPAGGCFGTLADMLKLLQLHLNKGVWDGKALIQPQAWREMHTVQYEKQIAEAAKAGKPAAHQSWGLGPLLRGTGPAEGGHAWFGFGDRASPGIFGHAGISTVIGVGDPSLDLAIAFVSTDSPKPEAKTTALRNGVTNRVFKAVA